MGKCITCGGQLKSPDSYCQFCFGDHIVANAEMPPPGTWLEDHEIEELEDKFMKEQRLLDECNHSLQFPLPGLMVKRLEELKRRHWIKQQDIVARIFKRREEHRI